MAEGMDPLSVDEQRKQIADRLFQEEAAQEAQQQEFRQRAWDMTQPPPDQAAEALSLGNKFGVPRQAVEADPELWRRKDENARASLMREVSPRTLAWLDNEDNYAVAKDDKDILAEIESTFSKIGYAIKGGAQRFAAGGVAYERQAIGETMDYYRRLDAWEQREERRKKLGQGAPQGWRTVRTPDIGTISGFDLPIYYGNLDAAPGASGIVREQVRKALPATMRPMFMSQVDRYDAKAVRPILERKMAEVDARGRAVTAEFTESLDKARSDNFILNGLTQAMTSITEMAPSMAAFFVFRGRGGATLGSGAMGAQVFGAEYLEGVYNLNLDERAASDRALLQAGVEVVTERISLGVLDDMLKSDKGFLTKLGVSMAAEQIQEQAATLGNRLVDIPYVAPDTTVQQFLADTPEAAANTAITTLFAAGITNTTLLTIDSVARRMVTDSINASESAGDRAIKTLLDKAQKAKTSKRSPEKMAEFIEGLAEQSNLETVVVDLDGVVQALNQVGINPAETLSALGVSQDELQQRYERFGEIEVKTSTLVTSPAMTAHRAAIEPHVKAKQDAATPAQKEALRADFEAALKDGAAQIQDALEAGKTTAEKVTQVRESLKARILGAGMDTQGPQLEAKLDALTALLTTLPQRTGQDVLDFYAARAPKIQGVMEGEVMEEADVLGQAEDEFGPETPLFRGTDDPAGNLDGLQNPDGWHGAGIYLTTSRRDAAKYSTRGAGKRAELMDDQIALAERAGDQEAVARLTAQRDRMAQQGTPTVSELRARMKNPVTLDNDGGTVWQPAEANRLIDALVSEIDDAGITYGASIGQKLRTQLQKDGRLTASDFERIVRAEADADFIRAETSPGQVISQAYQALGHDGVVMKNASDILPKGSTPKGTTHVTVFDKALVTPPDQSASADLLGQQMEQQRRGQYDPRTDVITLFEQADVTTLMHEAAHWYLETLYSMSVEPDAHPFVVEQYEAIRKWGKVGPDFRMYDDTGRLTPEAIELHESFAETFEVYFQTGEAPSASLRSAFHAFKKWITQLWKQYSQRRPTRDNLNPEIVAVMDRMLAVDEEIDAQVEGIIRSAEQQADELLKRGIITKRQRDTAIMNLETARESAKEDLMARLMEAKMREDEAWWNTERARVRRDVLREFDRSPVGRALSWLGYGQWKGDVPAGEAPGDSEAEFFQTVGGYETPGSPEYEAAVTKGLDMSTPARMARRKAWQDEAGTDPEMAETVLYHGTDKKFDAFRAGDRGIFLGDKETASTYGEPDAYYIRGELAPRSVLVQVKKEIKADREKSFFGKLENERPAQQRELVKRLKAMGYAGYKQGMGIPGALGEVVIFDPSNIRSVNAAFDPDNAQSANLLAQSIRTAARMPMEEVDAWVRANVTVSESQLGTDTLTVIKFPLTEDPGAPEVMLSIRLKERSNRRDQGRADVNLFLDNQMADALETVEDPVQRGVMAKMMFAKTVMVMRQYAQEYDVKAFNFTAAESQAEGTNAKSREALYRYMLSSLSMPGYTAYEIESQTSIVNRDEDGAKSANPMLGMAGFVIVKDGVNVEDFAKNEILRGSQRGGDVGEVVTVARATPLGRANTGDGGGRGRRGAGAADTGGAVEVTLGQSAAPLQSRPIRIQGTGPGGRVLNWDLGMAFTERHMKKYGRALDPADPADYKIILKSMLQDFKEQSAQQDTGDAWYTDDINEAIALTSQIYPELNTSPQFRDLFLTVTALLSPQQKPVQNWENAILAMRSWRETGRIEFLKPSGKQYGVLSHTTGLKMFQHLIDTIGLQAALQWVQTEHTGREIAEMRMASGLFSPIDKATGKVSTKVKDYLASETNLNESVLGIYGFGPKVGDFMQNSVGIDQNAVTVDLWLARTYNRLIGRLTDVSPAQAAAGGIASEIRGRAEREHIKRLVRDAAKKAGLDPSAMQAALWYFEQRLYRAHGIKSDSQNFSGAARTALQKRAIDVRSSQSNQRVESADAGEGVLGGGDGRGRDRSGSYSPLPGAPRNLQGPIAELVAVAERYARANGIVLRRQAEYAEVDPERAARIAQAYEDMQHAPNDPAVQEAYADLIRQTRAQYDALVEAGYVFTFFDGASDPYAGNPSAAMRDLRNNKHMAVYGTYDGYGTEGITAGALADNPMLADTGLQWPDQDGVMRQVVANDLFRAVHDAFGHGLEGAGFRARGEENAWQAHVRLFTGPAVGAITSETRGQNSWLNYGPYGETNRTAKLEGTVFAEQKTGLMPEWTWTEGRVADEAVVEDTLGQSVAPTFYSALGRFVSRSGTARAPAAQWKGMIQNAAGIKAEEVEWTGVMEWLDLQQGSVTREALAQFVEANGVRVEEVVRGGDTANDELQRQLLPLIEERDRVRREFDALVSGEGIVNLRDMSPEEQDNVEELSARLSILTNDIDRLQRLVRNDDTKWSSWTLPGGENYREMLLTLPVKPTGNMVSPNGAVFTAEELANPVVARTAGRVGLVPEDAGFRSSHWSEPNVLAHVRFKERVGPNGERVLALEEIQSDWHQAGRERGYKEKGEPATFEDWYAGNGMALFGMPFDQLDARAQGMARQRWEDATRRGFTGAVPNAPFKNNAWTELVLKRMIRFAAENGFDAVAWIPGNIQNGRVVETDDNRGDFYDKIVPNVANKLGKKYGARVTQAPIDMPAQAKGTGWEDTGAPRQALDAGALQWWTLPITPELAAAAMTEGFPLFQPGDPKGWGETAPPPDLPPMRLDLARTEEIYGKAAVDALPKAIKDRYRDQTSVDTMLAAARGAAKTLKRKPPKSLFQFIRARKSRAVEGKSVPQKQWGIKGATDELKAMDRADLINEASGIDIDYMRELAEGAGYLPENSTVNDLLNAIDREARGEPVYSEQDANEVLEIQSAQQWADWLSENGVDIFEADQRKLKAAIAKVTRTTNADLKSPDEAAELLGFENGEQLLKALAEAGSREKYIDAETDRRMREEFGDPFTTGEFAEAARQAAEAEVKFRAAEIEIEALARALGETAASKLAKEMAMDALSVMTVKELAGWERFLEIERREMRNAMKAVQAGDISKALTHKRRQLVNGHLAKAAREKSEAIEKTRKDLLTYFTSKGRRDKIDRGYLEKIEALLEGYELRKSKQGPGQNQRAASAKLYVDQMIAEGREAEIAPEAMLLAESENQRLLERANLKVWRNLTVEEVEYLVGTVKNLAHLGRRKNKLLKERDKRKFDAIIAEAVERLEKNGMPGGKLTPKPTREYSIRKTTGEKVSSALRNAHHWQMRIEQQMRQLDGQENGPLWNMIFRPFTEAADVLSKLSRESAEAVAKIWNIYTPIERLAMVNKSIALPELGRVWGRRWTKMEVISMALNWGTEYNRQALLEGYGWTADQVEAVFARVMTDKDWDLVEALWKEMGRWKDMDFAVHKRVTGTEPKPVEGVPFMTATGRAIQGKYYHIQYDSTRRTPQARRQGKQDEKELLDGSRRALSSPATKNGALVARTGSGGKQVKLHISVFEKGLSETIHRIAYREALIDVSKIVQDERFAMAYEQASGEEAYSQLMPWLEAIAQPNGEQLKGLTAFFAFIRRRLPIVYMGGKVGTAMIQATGLVPSMYAIGPGRVAAAAARAYALGPLSIYHSWKEIAEKSEFMRDRPQGFDRDVRDAGMRKTSMGVPNSFWFMLITAVDLAVSVPTWNAAYGKALEGKVKGIDRDNEEDAIAYADAIIRRTQTAGLVQDLPRLMRDKGAGGELQKQVTMLYGYFSGLYAWTTERVIAARRGDISPLEFTMFAVSMFVIVPALTEILSGRLFDDDEDDEESVEKKLGDAVISNFAGMFPVIRDLVKYQQDPHFGYNLSPAASLLHDLSKTIYATDQAVKGESEFSEAETKRAVRTVSAFLGLPGAQMVITGDYLADLLAGEEDPMADPADAASEALLRDTR